MPRDPYAVLRALLRAEAARTTAGPAPEPAPGRPAPATPAKRQHPAREPGRG
ncbi:hypothetical protein [Streptomyces griseoviridis]|uniref:Uncharacterized protein n=1 Tax=Streptomyces griseoviridis TaxID=45398 RepID=A0ABT9LGK2_STRGD|nr:hypothetical protein [Streptomyces griseoviridis]MDP9682798.1 hypothetical protein [Streptomyces griseoviridis]